MITSVEKPAETQSSIWLASHLARVPNSRSGGHEFESPNRRELGALTKSRRTLGGRSFFDVKISSHTWGPWVRAVSARTRPSETSPGTPAPLGCNNSTLFQYTRHDKLVCKDGLFIFKNVFLKMLFAVRGVAFCNWYSTPLVFFPERKGAYSLFLLFSNSDLYV
jgi:hypothetical protein